MKHIAACSCLIVTLISTIRTPSMSCVSSGRWRLRLWWSMRSSNLSVVSVLAINSGDREPEPKLVALNSAWTRWGSDRCAVRTIACWNDCIQSANFANQTIQHRSLDADNLTPKLRPGNLRRAAISHHHHTCSPRLCSCPLSDPEYTHRKSTADKARKTTFMTTLSVRAAQTLPINVK